MKYFCIVDENDNYYRFDFHGWSCCCDIRLAVLYESKEEAEIAKKQIAFCGIGVWVAVKEIEFDREDYYVENSSSKEYLYVIKDIMLGVYYSGEGRCWAFEKEYRTFFDTKKQAKNVISTLGLDSNYKIFRVKK